ncbi:MAG: hypothetical protein GEU90_23090 [Gemmatimonas sp.]|nr:hypothetical protein [Gemmatimonas sp.]
MTLGDVGLNCLPGLCEAARGRYPDFRRPAVNGLLKRHGVEGERRSVTAIETGATRSLIGAEVGEIVVGQIGVEVALERGRVLR